MPELLEFLESEAFAQDGSMPQQLRNSRIRLGLTQAELGYLIGVGSKRVSDWQNGKKRPTG